MKFIQNIHGDFVRVDKITALTVDKDSYGKWHVHAFTNNYSSKLKTFDTEAEARSWLKEFVDALDEEGYRHAD